MSTETYQENIRIEDTPRETIQELSIAVPIELSPQTTEIVDQSSNIPPVETLMNLANIPVGQNIEINQNDTKTLPENLKSPQEKLMEIADVPKKYSPEYMEKWGKQAVELHSKFLKLPPERQKEFEIELGEAWRNKEINPNALKLASERMETVVALPDIPSFLLPKEEVAQVLDTSPKGVVLNQINIYLEQNRDFGLDSNGIRIQDTDGSLRNLNNNLRNLNRQIDSGELSPEEGEALFKIISKAHEEKDERVTQAISPGGTFISSLHGKDVNNFQQLIEERADLLIRREAEDKQLQIQKAEEAKAANAKQINSFSIDDLKFLGKTFGFRQDSSPQQIIEQVINKQRSQLMAYNTSTLRRLYSTIEKNPTIRTETKADLERLLRATSRWENPRHY